MPQPAHDARPVLSVRDFTWTPRDADTPTVNGLTFDVHPGERVLLVGPSGSGKSTLLMALAGVLASAIPGVAGGTITIGSGDSIHGALPIGFVRQDPETNIVLSRVRDELAFGPENMGRSTPDVDDLVEGAIRRFSIDGDNVTATLSGGTKQRVAVAAVSTMQPQLWLLDEPTAQLDPDTALSVRNEVLATLRDRDVLVIVDHSTELWWPHVTRVLALDAAGRIVLNTTPDEALRAHQTTLQQLGVWLPNDADTIERSPQRDRSSQLDTDLVPAVSASGLVAQYATASHPLNLELQPGQAVVLSGPNGAGKSSVALTLSGLMPPAAGTVCVNGVDPHSLSDRELARTVAMVFQQPAAQFIAATVRDEIHVAATSTLQADTLLDRIGLGDLANRNPRELSGGQQRRLSVATALASAAPLIIADEPTFGQDRTHWWVLVQLFREALAAGRSLVLVSHETRLAVALDARQIRLEPR